jgi:uncharacterized lipoprotein YddW (UPF0748 family)
MLAVFAAARRRWLLGLMIFSLVTVLALPIFAPGQAVQGRTVNRPAINRPEIRGVWMTNIDSNVLFQRQRLNQSIDQLHKLNFNTIYPVVWNWGYTLYPSKVAQKNVGQRVMPNKSIELISGKPLPKGEGLAGRDMLQEAIARGHRHKMAVIPWFEFGLMATAASDPSGSDLAKRHPQWLTQRRDGTKIYKEGKHDRVWLNPLHPGVKRFIKDLIVEVVRNYDVDGIQVDDHFGYPFEFGYDDLTVSVYKAEHQGKAPPIDPKDLEWTNWRASKVTALLKDLFKEIKKANPKAIVSVSPNPQEFSKSMFLADWVAWERAGLVEEVLIQVYRSSLEKFKGELIQPEVQRAKTHIPVGIGVLAGLKPRPVKMTQIREQVQAVRQQKLAGTSFFFYETLWNLKPPTESVQARQASFKQLFDRSVPRVVIKNLQP